MKNICAVAPLSTPNTAEKHFDFFLNRPSWHSAFFRRIGIVQSKGRGESEQEQARQILSGLCALFVCMAKKLYASNSGKGIWAPLYWVSGTAVDIMLFVNETNMHIHDRMFNNTSLRPYVIGNSCIVCATFRVMKQYFRSVEGLATSDDFLRWEGRLTGNGGGNFLGKLLQTMIGNAKMHGMSAEMVAEAKRCCDFIKTLSDMAEIQYYNPQKNEAVHFTFIDNRSVHLRQNINAYTTFNIFTITSSARHKETAAADSAMPMGAEKATVSDRRKRSSSRERANPGSGTKAIKHPKLPKSAQEFPSLGFRGSKNDRYALLTVLIHAIENNMGRLIEDEIWLQIESDVTLKKLFKDKWKPNFSNAKKDLIAIFNHYGIRWHFVGRTFQLERDKYGNILELKNLRDALRKDTTNRRA